MRSTTSFRRSNSRVAAALVIVGSVLLGARASSAQQPASDGPDLRDVLASVDRHHPALLSAGLSRTAAEQQVRAARGSFDVQLSAGGESTLGGKYDATRFGLELGQQLPWSGPSWSAGYFSGWDFPVYDAKHETSRWGEAHVGLEQALLAGRSIDVRRKDLAVAELEAIASQLKLRAYRIDLRFAAVSAYLEWVRASAQAAVEEQLVANARQRQAGVELQIDSGALPRLESVDNLRLIASRREKLILARQKLAQAGLKLGLYYRDAEGQAIVPRGSDAPQGFPAQLTQVLERAPLPSPKDLSQRPDLLLYDNALAKLSRKLEYADNRALPKLNAKAKLSHGMGTPRQYAPFASTQSETRATVGLSLSLPLQRREALGRAAALRAERQALALQRGLAYDKARVQLESARVAVEAARERQRLAEEARAAAETLEEAERQKFADGLSNILTVNLREAASAAARSAVVETRYEYFLELARLRAAAAAL